MFAGHLVDAPLGGGVGDQHAGLREGAGRPDVEESAAAAGGHPQAGILAVPAAGEVGIGGVGVVVGVLAGAVEFVGAVAAKEADVVHHGILAGHPFGGHGARVDSVGVEPDADHDVGAAFGRLDERLGSADALKRRGPVEQIDLRGAGV